MKFKKLAELGVVKLRKKLENINQSSMDSIGYYLVLPNRNKVVKVNEYEGENINALIEEYDNLEIDITTLIKAYIEELVDVEKVRKLVGDLHNENLGKGEFYADEFEIANAVVKQLPKCLKEEDEN